MTTAAFALAATAPTVRSSVTTAAPGDTVTFTITINNYGLSGSVSASPNLNWVRAFSDAEDTDLGFPIDTTSPTVILVANATTITYVYTVAENAQPGAPFSFTVSNTTTSNAQNEASGPFTISAGGNVAGGDTDTGGGDTGTGGGDTGTGGGTDRPRDDVHKVGDVPVNTLPAALIGLALAGALGIVGYIKLR